MLQKAFKEIYLGFIEKAQYSIGCCTCTSAYKYPIDAGVQASQGEWPG